MKYLIFGVNGMAGHMLALYLKKQGNDVTGFAKEPSIICKTIIGNALCETEVKAAVYSDCFDIVINCIGVLNYAVDADMPTGIYLNSVFPHYLDKLLRNMRTRLIHISTDCVFQGEQGAYTEKSFPDAGSAYGRSKALGEVIDQKNLTIRTSIIGPELKKNGVGLFHWFMGQKEPINGYNKVIWTGVTTLQLAKAVELLCEKKVTGLYHLVNNVNISKYNLLQLINLYFKNGAMIIYEDSSVISDKSLLNTRTECADAVTGYDNMISDMKEWIYLHKNLYSQYICEKEGYKIGAADGKTKAYDNCRN